MMKGARDCTTSSELSRRDDRLFLPVVGGRVNHAQIGRRRWSNT